MEILFIKTMKKFVLVALILQKLNKFVIRIMKLSNVGSKQNNYLLRRSVKTK